MSPDNAAIIITRLVAVFAAKDKTHATEYRWKSIFTKPSDIQKVSPVSYAYCMAYSKCEFCNGKEERDVCMNCNSTGQIYNPDRNMRISHLIYISTDSMNVIKYDNEIPGIDVLVAASLASEHHSGEQPTRLYTPAAIKYPVGTPHCPGADKRKIKAEGGNYSKKKGKFAEVSKSNALLIQTLIREVSPEFHSKIIVDPDCVLYDIRAKKITVFFKGLGSNTCRCKKKDHKDSYVYAIITPQGVKIVCSSKEIVGNMECRKRSRDTAWLPISSTRKQILFPSEMTMFGSQNTLNTGDISGNDLYIADASIAIISDMLEGSRRKVNVLGETIF